MLISTLSGQIPNVLYFVLFLMEQALPGVDKQESNFLNKPTNAAMQQVIDAPLGIRVCKMQPFLFGKSANVLPCK